MQLYAGGLAASAQNVAPAGSPSNSQDLQVTDSAYSPRKLVAPADKAVKLSLITSNTTACSREFVISALNVSALLSATGRQSLEIPPQKAGTQLRFACSMGMFTGVIVFQ